VDLSNRTLVVFGLFTAVLVALAALVTFGTQPSASVSLASTAPAAIIPTVTRTGGSTPEARGPVVVRRAAGRTANATLTCGTFRTQRAFDAGVAGFPRVPGGECSVLVDGTSEPYEPVFAGDRLSCRAEGVRTSCTGGMAANHAARLTVTSDSDGTVELDGQRLGEIPLFGASARVGLRQLRVVFPSGRSASWALVVMPDQNIRVHFPAPGSPTDAAPPSAGPRTRISGATASDTPTEDVHVVGEPDAGAEAIGSAER